MVHIAKCNVINLKQIKYTVQHCILSANTVGLIDFFSGLIITY